MANLNEIETALALAEAETGVRGGKRAIPLCFATPAKRSRFWTEKEDRLIRENYGFLSEPEIAEQLGRTRIGLHIHIERELHLPSMSKHPGILTAEQVANGIGCDGKSVHLLMDTGRMPGRQLPSQRTMRVVDRIALVRWILNPDHWCYFKPGRVGGFFRKGKRGIGESYDFKFWSDTRKLVAQARRRWKDRWLTPGQAVKHLRLQIRHYASGKIDSRGANRYVNNAIRKGNLKATRWGNWWIRKSDLPGPGKTINYQGEIVKKNS